MQNELNYCWFEAFKRRSLCFDSAFQAQQITQSLRQTFETLSKHFSSTEKFPTFEASSHNRAPSYLLRQSWRIESLNEPEVAAKSIRLPGFNFVAAREKVFPLCCFAVISLRINSLNLNRERVEGGSRVENLWLEAGVTRSVHQIEDWWSRSSRVSSAGGRSVLIENKLEVN